MLPDRLALALYCGVGGEQNVLWFGPAGFQGIFPSEFSDTDPASWLGVMTWLVNWKRLAGLYLTYML